MRALHLGALLAVCVVSSATAQTAVGPVAITNTVNGVPVTVNATSWITVNSSGNELTIQARIFADLIDLQRKFASILDAFKPSGGRRAFARLVLGISLLAAAESEIGRAHV